MGWVVVSKRLDPGSQAGMTRYIAWGGLFWSVVVASKRLDPGSSHPTKPLRALAGTPTGRDDTVCSLSGLFLGQVVAYNTITNGLSIYILQILSILSSAFYNPFHLSTFKDPVDPVIRVL